MKNAGRRCMPRPGLPVGRILNGVPWRRNSVGDAEERALLDFLLVMLGELGPDPSCTPQSFAGTEVQAPSRNTGQCGLCLAELTPDVASRLCTRGGSDGLVVALQPYLEDLLTRRQSFRSVVDMLAGLADAEESAALPRVFADMTSKDLFLALLFALPKSRQMQLSTVYANLRYPLPIVFRCPIRPSGEIHSIPAFFRLHEIACVPQAGRQLLVSLGTQKAVNCGKTTLIGALALTPTAEEDLDVRPPGPLHAYSCDLLCANPRRWVADAHGFWGSFDEEFRAAVLSLVFWGRAVCLIQCALGDFHAKSGAPSRELAAMLAAVSGSLAAAKVAQANASAANSTRGSSCSGVVVLVRDCTPEIFAPRRAAIEEPLRQHSNNTLLGVFPIDDCRTFRSAARRTTAVERLRGSIEECLAKAWPKGTATPSLEALTHTHRTVLEVLRSIGQPGMPIPAPQFVAGTDTWHSDLGNKFVNLLNKAGGAASALFPLSAIDRRLTVLRRAESNTGTSQATALARGSTRLEQLRLEEDDARNRAAEIEGLQQSLLTAETSECVLFFRLAASAHGPHAVAELGLYLEHWKEPQVLPLLDRQRELLEQSTKHVNGKPSTPSKDNAEVDSVVQRLADLDFSLDSFWTELELLAQRSGAELMRETYACREALIREGRPFQVLHGRPLSMAGDFLKNVLQAIDAPHKDSQGIFVISVIGAQSSAKSTLLNFLFGCGFAVSAGRCTRGLYASYFQPVGSQPLLVLDSEGLLSLGSEGAVFDGQIALMCMTCSHLILINHKGELSRQLQDLLEVCLFAMRHLRLMRLQPRLVFVLRDQHDRSSTVHEDMLKQMRSHLEDTAKSLGAPLEDLILLDGTAVFLLPSAVTSELRQGLEVCWTSELFAREVLRLRSEVFRWLNDDAKRRTSGVAEFNSLKQWYDYASTVWETLIQFGDRLLHYKTIHEIELRRELADVAKQVVQDALDGNSGADGSESATLGFHGRARQMVDNFVARIQAGSTKLDLDTTDMEFCRALACLRDECVTQLEERFLERAADPRFTITQKEQAKQQIRTPVEWAFENHLYTWKLHLKRASDEQAMHALWIHFTGVLNRHLASSGHRSTLSEAESVSLFDSEWRAYEAQYVARCKSLKKDWQTLAHEVTLLFNHAVAKLQHEAGTLALLKEVGPQSVALPPEKNREGGPPTITDQSDKEWEEQYFHLGWWETMKKRGLAFLKNTSLDDSITSSTSLIPRMRQAVQQGLDMLRSQIIEHGALDEATAAEALRHIATVMLQDIETRLLNDSVTLKRPQMLHALHVALRVVSIEALVAVEASKQQKAMADLLAQKAQVEEHFLVIIQANKGDVERAKNFSQLYHRSLTNWIDHEVTRLAAEVRNQVLLEMPDPQKSSERAWQLSFAAHDWSAVLEYVLDMNAYLEKIFLSLFHQRKRSYVTSARSRLERRVAATYRLLQEITNQWARREKDGASAAPEVDVTRGLELATPRHSVRNLKDFITTHAERIPADAEKADAHRQLAERLPESADFPINDPRLFAEAFQTHIGDFVEGPEIPAHLSKQLEKSLQEQSIRAWTLIRGCSQRCPLCGSKCDLVGEHTRHHCSHHLFPAFHGWMDRSTGLPSFNHCLGCATREGKYECRDGEWRSLEEYLLNDHPSWLPFVHDKEAGDRDVQLLRAAWVNCREPLLEHFSPMIDSCPEEWREVHEEGAAGRLTKADLQTCKECIRSLRQHKWAPPEE